MEANGNSIVSEDRRPSLTIFVLKVSGDLEIDVPTTAFLLAQTVVEDVPNLEMLVWEVLVCPTVFRTG